MKNKITGCSSFIQPDLNTIEHGIYLAVGRNDKLIGPEGVGWCETFAQRLLKAGKAIRFEEFENAPHGFGLGVGTGAEGWFRRAVSFWQEQEWEML